MRVRFHQVLITFWCAGCGVSEVATSRESAPVISVRSERPTQEGLPQGLAKQQPLWERLREPTFRRSAEAFRVYPDGQTVRLSATTRRWEAGPPLGAQQLLALSKAIEQGSFFGLESAVGEEDSGGQCAKPHGGCMQWTVNLKGRTHWVRRPKTVPVDVEKIEASLR